jgi:Flp pilus assembly protein TadD
MQPVTAHDSAHPDDSASSSGQPEFAGAPLHSTSSDSASTIDAINMRDAQPVTDEATLASLSLLRQDAINQRTVGDLAGAEDTYRRMLRLDPANAGARVDRAYVRAWQKNYAGALDDFQLVLHNDSTNLSAINGLGYTYAWSRNYKGAEAQFNKALRLAPGQPDAERGLAYSALWSGDGDLAVERFSELHEKHPADVDITVGLGQAYVRAGNTRKARAAFEEVLKLAPDNAAAAQGLRATERPRPLMEFTAWAGLTWFTSITDVDDNPQAGLRLGEIAINAMPNMRLWFQYDNQLGQDNLVMSRAARGFPAFYIGGFYNYHPMLTSRLEVGWRDLPGSNGQRLFRGEQVVMFPNKYVVKAGGFVGPRDDQRVEWIAYSAVGIPVQDNFKIEPTFFYSRSGLPEQHQWRLLVSGEYFLPNRVILGGGIAGGQEKVIDGSSGIYDIFFRVTAPLKGLNTLHGLIRRESSSEFESLTVISVGFTLGLEGL